MTRETTTLKSVAGGSLVGDSIAYSVCEGCGGVMFYTLDNAGDVLAVVKVGSAESDAMAKDVITDLEKHRSIRKHGSCGHA